MLSVNPRKIISLVRTKLTSIDLYLLLLCLFCIGILFHGLNNPKVQTWDELTNVQVVLESEGLNLKYEGDAFFEKPPFWYWFTSLLVEIFGSDNWVYRLPSVIAATGIVMTIYLFLRKRGSKFAAFVVAGSFLLIPQNLITNVDGYFSSHTFKSADLDALQIFFIFLSSILVLENKKNFQLSCLLLGVAFMIKGPLAVVFLVLNSVILIVSQDERARIKLRELLIGLCLFSLVITPWHLYMHINSGADFWNDYLAYHVVTRSLAELEGHAQTTWFYFKLFFDFRVNPFWPLFILATVKRNFEQLYTKYCFVAVLLVVCVFTVVETKLAWYILPVYPYMLVFIHSLFSKQSPSAIITNRLSMQYRR